MFRVLTCLVTEHNLWLVLLAGAVCFAASLAAVCLFGRARSTAKHVRAGWIAAAGAAAGCGIWATHFIAMLAYEPGVPVGYDVALTTLSLTLAIAITGAGLAIATTRGRAAAPFGGLTVAVGIAAMHYTGMAALEVSGRVGWSAALVIASILLGMVFAVPAMWLAARARTARATLSAACLLTLAIVAHHFTAMGAVELMPDPTRVIGALAFSESTLALTIAGVTLAVLSASILGAVMDRRLAEKNTLLDTALNNMNHGLMMFDADSRVILCNQRYIDLYRLPAGSIRPGLTLREVIERRIAAGTFEGDPDGFCAKLLGTVQRGESVNLITTTPHGRTIVVLGEPLPGGGWVATHQDVTEERRRESSFRFLFEDNPLPMWVWEHATFRFLAVNKAAVEKYGYSHEQFRSLRLHDIKRAEWETLEAIVSGDDRPLRAGMISQHTRADGSVIDVEVYGRSMVYDGRPASLAASIDITQRKHAEDELREAREFLHTVIESVPLPIVVKDAERLTYVLANRATEEQFGVPRGAGLGKTVHELLPKPEADVTEKRDREMIAANATLFVEAKPTNTPRGMRFMSSLRVPIRDVAGKPRYILGIMEDVTERKQQEDELRRTRTFLDTIIENMPAMLTVKDAAELRYVLVNRAAEQFFGLRSEDMIGKRGSDIFQATEPVEARDREVIQSGELRTAAEQPVETRNGTRLISSKKILIRAENGQPQYVLSLGEDVTDQKRARDQIAHLERHDPLTDLPNRAAFNDKLAAMLARVADAGMMFAIMSIDLDRFKEVNDVFGQDTGDALLCEVGRRIGAAAGGAYLARLGGDEFALIVSEGVQPSTAESLAERLLQAMSAEIVAGGQSLHVGLSIGIAVYPSDGQDATTLLGNANAALYRAKTAGRGTIRFFEAHMDEHLRERRALQHELHAAIEQDELTLYYQPQARISGETIGFEALVRWHHPIRGTVSPGMFIPLAEESGLIMEMGESILREACREAASWPKSLQVAVNLSPVQFRHGDLPTLVHEILLETGLAPHRLELEITEGVLINDFARAVSILRRLKLLGVSIAMDDFGTGYSSLSYLQSFPFDKIKIDRTFIANLIENHYSATIVRAVIGLGRGLNLPVMAEGVETAEQLAFLARESCDEVQGYHIGRPAPIEGYADLVGRKATPRFKIVSG